MNWSWSEIFCFEIKKTFWKNFKLRPSDDHEIQEKLWNLVETF